MSPTPFPDLQMRDARERVVGTLDMTINRSMPGMLHGALVRSPVPHARIISIDVTEAAGRPGVIAVITSREIAGLGIDPSSDGSATISRSSQSTA
ncbi:MAG: hypothetical protein ACRDJ5_00560 [Actinomycetota bacterium]